VGWKGKKMFAPSWQYKNYFVVSMIEKDKFKVLQAFYSTFRCTLADGAY